MPINFGELYVYNLLFSLKFKIHKIDLLKSDFIIKRSFQILYCILYVTINGRGMGNGWFVSN